MVLLLMTDICVYSKSNENNHFIICLHVDDILIFGTSMNVINETKLLLYQNFDIKDPATAGVILELNT